MHGLFSSHLLISKHPRSIFGILYPISSLLLIDSSNLYRSAPIWLMKAKQRCSRLGMDVFVRSLEKGAYVLTEEKLAPGTSGAAAEVSRRIS